MSEKEVLNSSFFGNGYVTPLNVEIADLLHKRGSVSRQEVYDLLRGRGYPTEGIASEIDRQWYASALRYIRSQDMYVRVEIGMKLWEDICERIYDQKAMVAGQLQFKDGLVLDICRTDFQSSGFKRIVMDQGFHQAPVMRWTRHYTPEKAKGCLSLLLGTLRAAHRGMGDRSFLLKTLREVIKDKKKRSDRMWLVTFARMSLELTVCQKKVLETIFSLGKGPVDWKGKLVFMEEVERCTGLPQTETEQSLEYLEEKGIIRGIEGGYTPTGQGFVLVRYVTTRGNAVTFAAVCRHEDYELEVNVPFSELLRDTLIEQGGKHSKWDSLILFPDCTQAEVTDMLDIVMRYYHE